MALVLLLSTLCLSLWLPAQGCGSLTSGFPSLEELRRNGSLLERYSTHDGEMRSVPAARSTCSGVRVTKIAFIALPGNGNGKTLLLVNGENEVGKVEIVLTSASQTFGELGYELSLPTGVNVYFNEGDTLWIRHPPHQESGVRLLYQEVGHEARRACWSTAEPAGPENCQHDYDIPLLAIETEAPSCVKGLMNTLELKRGWENRAWPILYTSPEREIPLNCPSSATVSRILVGAYPSVAGDRVPHIIIGNNDSCSVSTKPVTEGLDVYECVLDSPVIVHEDTVMILRQRNSTGQIGLLHNGYKDTPFIYLDISEGCSTGQLLSEAALWEITALFIPNIIQREDDQIEFEHFKIEDDIILTNWTFVGRRIGKGEAYPMLAVIFPSGLAYTLKYIENTNCTDTVYPNVYECSVTPELVKAGHIIALVLPPVNSSSVALSFILNRGPHGESYITGTQVEGYPLFTLGQGFQPFLAAQSCLPLTPSSTALLPTSTNDDSLPPTVVENSGNYIVTVAAISLSGLIVLAASALTVLLVLWIRCWRRSKRGNVATTATSSGGVATVPAITMSDNPA